MGYTTQFSGTLLFGDSVDVSQIRAVQELMGCERSDLPEFDTSKYDFNHLPLRINRAMTGIEWDGGEKWYGSVDAINYLVERIRENHPTFTLNGVLDAQGEDAEDRWRLVVDDGVARRVDNPPNGRKATCPRCGEIFFIETQQ